MAAAAAAAALPAKVVQCIEGFGAEAAQLQAASGIDGVPGSQLPQMPGPAQAAERSVTYMILPVAVPACAVPVAPAPMATSVQLDELLRQAMPNHYED